MNKKMSFGIIALFFIGILFISGCTETKLSEDDRMEIIKICDDSIICYKLDTYLDSPIHCFRDTDLVGKYCGG